jgi:hypothetical protein
MIGPQTPGFEGVFADSRYFRIGLPTNALIRPQLAVYSREPMSIIVPWHVGPASANSIR